jgi:DNA-binding Xre family transcriptional regulator
MGDEAANVLLGRRVLARRRSLQMNVRALKDASGIAISQISRIERGHGSSIDAIRLLAAALGTTVGYLVGELPCTCCQGAPPAGLSCRECGAGGPAFKLPGGDDA